MTGETLYRDVAGDIELDGKDFDDGTVAGLHVRQPEPLTTAELGYSADGVRIEVSMRALHKPFSWHDNADSCADWIASDRYEQSVSTTGVIELGGRTVEFQTGQAHADERGGVRRDAGRSPRDRARRDGMAGELRPGVHRLSRVARASRSVVLGPDRDGGLDVGDQVGVAVEQAPANRHPPS